MVRIPLPDGGTLEGILDERSSELAVLVCHPHPAFGGRMSTPLIVELADAFAAAGLTTLRFHYRGIEGSDGVATGGLEEERDVLAAVAFLDRPVAIVGYSFGALMAWKAIADGHRPFAYVGIALPTTLLTEERLAYVERVMTSGVPTLLLAGDRDPLCDLERVRGWSNGRVLVEAVAGEAHTFSFTGSRAIVARTVAFVLENR